MGIKKNFSEQKPVIGITMGDYNGIGAEVILKTFNDLRMIGLCTPVLYGSMKILSKYKKILNLEEIHLHSIKEVGLLAHKKINLITCTEDTEIQPGQVTKEAGKAAFDCLEAATRDLLKGNLDGLVTAPINKHNIQNENFTFVGHTEYLAANFDVKEHLMLMVADSLRVGLVTGHLPLQDVSAAITTEKIKSKVALLIATLQKDFGIQKPRIAVLGLNPHAGEDNLLGKEEKSIIEPVIKDFREKGHLIYGCFPADGFFGMRTYQKYDGVLAMYHDQGLTPFKTLAFEKGVNYTAGLPIVRTSPDHGTAYNIAGKNQADETSMREAIYLACEIVKRKNEM
jgi:4-hydroxythreonine-4-phosphate dehydrogenase